MGAWVSAIAAFIAESFMPVSWQQLAQCFAEQLLPAQGNSASTGSAHSRMLSAMATDLAKDLILVMQILSRIASVKANVIYLT